MDRAVTIGAYVLPEVGDRRSAVAAASEAAVAGADYVITATSGPERSRYTSTNGAIDLAAACARRSGIAATATVTTWSSSAVSLQANLLAAHARGVTRLVCGNGSAPEDRAAVASGRWSIDVTELIQLVRGLNDGVDRFGHVLEPPTRFEIGVRIRAIPELSAEDRARIRRKIDAGADFIVSSPIYDPRSLQPLLDVVGGRIPVYATVHALRSTSEAARLRDELAAGCVPDDLVDRIAGAGDGAVSEGSRMSVETAVAVSTDVAGIVASRCRTDTIAALAASLPRAGTGSTSPRS